MLTLFDSYDGSAHARTRILDGLEKSLAEVRASKGRGDRGEVAAAEAAVKADPRRCIRFGDAGSATVYAAGRSYQGGRFETLRLCELRARALAARARAGRPATRLSLWVLDGTGPLTDIGALQATAAPNSLFQVASQWNCLEAPGRYVAEITEYFQDPTQGPRASISAFPGALIRHYAAPGSSGSRFVQTTDGPQLNLLGDLCAEGSAQVRNGYLRTPDIADPRTFARMLEDQFEAIQIGLHDEIEVVLGGDWDGGVSCRPHRTIAQAFTSTIAAGMYSELDEADVTMRSICRQLQRAAYLGTLLGAAALGKDRVLLTLIGGGVFANPIEIIWDAILWAVDEARAVLHRDLSVVVNGRNLSERIAPSRLRAAVTARGGELLRCDGDALSL